MTGTTGIAADTETGEAAAVQVEKAAEPTEAVTAAEPTADVAAEQDIEPLPLSEGDCVKCHYGVAVDIDMYGEAHKELSCMECHEEHPPAGENVIPECATCHDEGDSEHFALQQCASCHNPHHPLRVDFVSADEVRLACVSCHAEQVEELNANPSAHTEQDCNACHFQHGLEKEQYQTCLECHDGHTEAMTLDNCLECHKPHSPTKISFGDAVDVALCASCHEDVAASLAALPTQHSEMACSECHSEEHKNITACVDCHDQPHNEFMHTKFPECLICHRDPHNLAK